MSITFWFVLRGRKYPAVSLIVLLLSLKLIDKKISEVSQPHTQVLHGQILERFILSASDIQESNSIYIVALKLKACQRGQVLLFAMATVASSLIPCMAVLLFVTFQRRKKLENLAKSFLKCLHNKINQNFKAFQNHIQQWLIFSLPCLMICLYGFQIH